jgi:hypothetical protein
MTTSNEIVLENQLPGTPRSVWDVSSGSTNIQGFTTDISINQGDTVDFKINTDSANYRIDIYRLGYYNGDGARLVTSIQHQNGTSIQQPAPLTDPATGLVDAGNWQVTDSWNVPADAVSGVYIAKLVREDGTFGENLVPFIVRDDGGHSDIVLQTDDATWQAYNTWGNANLYGNNNSGVNAASAVSYDRPMNVPILNYYLDMALPAIMWLEKNGYDVSYITDVDTARNGAQLLDHKVFISVGKDEYWSAEQFAHVQAARDAGVNLQFWTGNDIYWKTEWKPSIDGSNTAYRTLVTYKETQRGTINPDGVWTGTWSDPNAPDGVSPQNALTGNIFEVLQTDPLLGTIQIPYEDTQLRFWHNTSIANTQPGHVASLASTYLGPEWNVDLDNGFRPAGLIDLSRTTVATAYQTVDFSTTANGPGLATHSLTLYRAPSGALVFGAGTMFWSWALDSHHSPLGSQNPPPDPNVQQAMVNLFADMGVQPATLQANLVAASHSTDNLAPSVTLTELDVNGSGSHTTLSLTGSASDLGGGVIAGVEVSTDGGAHWHPATGGTSWTHSSDGAVPTDVLARAVDDSLNIGAPYSVPTDVLGRAIVDSQTGGSARAMASLDTMNDRPWSVVWNNYDAAGHWDHQSITFDNGTVAVAQLDPLNTQPWSLVWNNYDAAGNWVAQSITFDNGTVAVASLDPLKDHPWSLVWNNYDANGNWVLQSINFNDGERAVAQLDPMNTQPWSMVWNNYDAAGNWDHQTITFDNGTKAVASLDPLNTQPWSLVWDNYDAAGRWDTQYVRYDDGSHTWSKIDSGNTMAWYTDNYVYDVNNNLTSHYQVMDDGSVVNLTSGPSA